MSSKSALKKRRKTVEYGKYGYLFILPFFAVFLFFQLYPLINTFYFSLFDYYERSLRVYNEFDGINNYLKILGLVEGEKPYVLYYLGNTLVMWLFSFIPQIVVSLLLASWLSNDITKLRARGVYKVMVYMPNIITAASISVLFNALFSAFGPMTTLLKDWGIIDQSYDFMKSQAGSRGLISFILFWMWYGNTTLLLISGVLGINPSLFEAADIDGANSRQKFFKITLPLLRPILLYVLVTSAIGGLQMYDIPALFNVSTNGTLMGLPDDKTTTVTMYIMRLYSNQQFGRAAAVSVFLFFITVIISVAFFIGMRDRDKSKKRRGGVVA